jgi:hypothetical protein
MYPKQEKPYCIFDNISLAWHYYTIYSDCRDFHD